jgi:outer membrane lipoprotein-sorting protein
MFSDLQFNKGVDKKTFTYKPTAGINAGRMPGSCNDPY